MSKETPKTSITDLKAVAREISTEEMNNVVGGNTSTVIGSASGGGRGNVTVQSTVSTTTTPVTSPIAKQGDPISDVDVSLGKKILSSEKK